MLTRLVIRNFKRFEEVDIELGNNVVFVGPNNSGKTSALQALALWDLGLRRWHEKRGGKDAPKKRTGVAINRRDLVAIPVPEANLFWKDRHVQVTERQEDRSPSTRRIRNEIEIEGVEDGRAWRCGFEFDFANSESIYCRPLGWASARGERQSPPAEALNTEIAYLPPMSGLAANETRLDPGAVQVRLGEGRTAEVLRNLCFQICEDDPDRWSEVVAKIQQLFGVKLEAPVYVPERGEIIMQYRDLSGVELDLSAAGRGLQQTLLLLAYLSRKPGCVLLLDEPDAHLEILRQRQIYQILTDLARQQGGQLIAASHSEVLLNEAADRDLVIAFVGRPHRIDDRGTQVGKAPRAIGFESYYQAEITGWVLYLEGSTDLAILLALAPRIAHPAARYLENPFVCYVENQLSKASEHFFGLREAKADLTGLVLLDRQDRPLPEPGPLKAVCWQRREIENYLLFPEVLEAYAASLAKERSAGPLFVEPETERLTSVMRECIVDQIKPAALRQRDDAWWHNVKASDEVLDPIFAQFFNRLALPNLMRKTDYHVLANLLPKELIDEEIHEKLDLIVEVAGMARPRE